jgi:hypothetical protein
LSVDSGAFASFFQAGFECSTHRYGSRRLDLLEATKHSKFAVQDFRRVQELGIFTVRSGARWHLIEQTAGTYCFDSLDPLLRAASETGMQVFLDLFHFGWPDHLDLFGSRFPAAFGRYVRALAKHLRQWPGVCGGYAPVNEISFLSWVAGDVANVYPHRSGEAKRLKAILVRCAVVASEILLEEIPGARLLSPEPVINIIGREGISGDGEAAEAYRLAQYEAWDMVSGRLAPELGGRPEFLDIVGANYYDRNQWVHHRETLHRDDPRYKPFRKILAEVWQRYGRPMIVSETGAEDGERAPWFRYVCDEVHAARQEQVPVEGLCLYPILNHPGWEDDRHCHNGLFDYPNGHGDRDIYRPLADELKTQQEKLRYSSTDHNVFRTSPHRMFVSSQMEFRSPAASTPDEPVCS